MHNLCRPKKDLLKLILFTRHTVSISQCVFCPLSLRSLVPARTSSPSSSFCNFLVIRFENELKTFYRCFKNETKCKCQYTVTRPSRYTEAKMVKASVHQEPLRVIKKRLCRKNKLRYKKDENNFRTIEQYRVNNNERINGYRLVQAPIYSY